MTDTWVEFTTEPPPPVRLGSDASLRCTEPSCDARFGRHVEEGYLLLAPGWIYQGEIWRSQSFEDELAAADPDDNLSHALRMLERMPKVRNKSDPREKLASSRLPAYVQCPDCRRLQTADPTLLDADEARASLDNRH
jgi:hypothetical protein